MQTDFQPDQHAMLEENDAFGSRVRVRIIKVHKGGNAIVYDCDKQCEREVSVANLKPETDEERDKRVLRQMAGDSPALTQQDIDWWYEFHA